jgi:hypothetical protein
MQNFFISTLILPILFAWNQIQYSELIGSWQLTYFDGIEKIVKSPEYQNASAAQRASMDARISYRLENTVYQFEEGDVLKFTDFEKQTVVQKSVKIELMEGNMLVIHEEKGDRLAKIIEFSEDKMVLQPISKAATSGKLTFERIKKQ